MYNLNSMRIEKERLDTMKELNYFFLSEKDVSSKIFSLKVSESNFGPHEIILNSLLVLL